MPRNSPYTLEICVDTPDAITAVAGHADRIELCSALDVGGLTPDPGLMAYAVSEGLETHALIRPRSGDFTLSDSDLSTTLTSIHAAHDLGVSGVVIGAERDGALDRAALEQMVQAASGLTLTLHRVIDVVDDPLGALDTAIDLGFHRVLTSGAAKSAAEGITGLNAMFNAASGRIEVMAGSGITSQTLPAIMAQTDITSFHSSCSGHSPLDQRYVAFGFGSTKRFVDKTELSKMVGLCTV